jgi:hypothetical protein
VCCRARSDFRNAEGAKVTQRTQKKAKKKIPKEERRKKGRSRKKGENQMKKKSIN